MRNVTKKVADKLEEIFKNRREEFEAKWDDIKVFIEYGMISEDKFYERAEKFCLLKNTDGKYFTLDDYKNIVKDLQTDKDKKLVYLYTNNTEDQHSYIQQAKEKGYDVLVMDGVLDSHFINLMERKLENSSFVRVDAETVDKLIKKDEEIPSKLNDAEKEKLKPIFENNIEKSKFTVVFESMSETDQPVMITQSEFMRRMKDMSALGGGMSYMGNMPEMYNLVVNTNHPLVSQVLNEENEENQNKTVKQLTDLALLSQNLLKGEALTAFIKRSIDIIK
jgi:molecular chaperone HtpG